MSANQFGPIMSTGPLCPRAHYVCGPNMSSPLCPRAHYIQPILSTGPLRPAHYVRAPITSGPLCQRPIMSAAHYVHGSIMFGPLCPVHYVRRPIMSACASLVSKRMQATLEKKTGVRVRGLSLCVVFWVAMCCIDFWPAKISIHGEGAVDTGTLYIVHFRTQSTHLDSSVNESVVFLYFSIRTPMEISHAKMC